MPNTDSFHEDPVITNLLAITDLCPEMWDSGDPLDDIHFTSDTISHQRLLNKLKVYGTVRDINIMTGSIKCHPAWQCPGPILFVLFINNLPDMIQSTAHIFAMTQVCTDTS